MSCGRVVLLNGGSSAGKTSLAAALQARRAERGEPWVVFGWDDFVPRLPEQWLAIPGHPGVHAADGAAYRMLDDDRAVFAIGPVGEQMLRAYRRAVAAMAHAGVDLIVDEVLLSDRDWDDWADALDGLAVTWVGVHCDLDVAAAREAARGDRAHGVARGTGSVTHAPATYDIEVDTTQTPVDEVAAHLDGALVASPHPGPAPLASSS